MTWTFLNGTKLLEKLDFISSFITHELTLLKRDSTQVFEIFPVKFEKYLTTPTLRNIC